MTYLWLTVAVLAVVFEAVTVQMVAIWFAPAALVSMVLSALKAPLWLQFTVFLCISALCVVFIYRKLRKNIAERCEKTNLDALIGLSARVEADIPADGCGRVLVKGISWKASCPNGAAQGETVRILRIDGVTLCCERIPVEPSNACAAQSSGRE